MSHYNSVHKFIPMPQVMKIPDAKAAADKECKKLETIQHGIWKKSKVKRRLLSTHEETKKVQFAMMDRCHLKNAELEPQLHKYKGRVVLGGDVVKRRLWSLCSFYRTGLVCVPDDCRKISGCYCKIAKLRRTSS